MRKDPPVDRAYLHATHILDLVDDATLVVNSPDGVRFANEKLYAQLFPEFCPETYVSRDSKAAHGTDHVKGGVQERVSHC